MNDLRRYITILENALQDELQKYRDELKYWQNERKKYWPVSKELLAQYKDGTHTRKDDGNLYWRNKNGQLHRDGDRPAYIGRDGRLIWLQNGKWHRDGDKPTIIDGDGTLNWYQKSDNENHLFGQTHRFRGPAIIRPDGTPEWYWRDEKIPVKSQEEFIEWLKKHKGLQRFRVNK